MSAIGYRYNPQPADAPDDDSALDSAADALCELASFVADATEDDPSANIEAAANEAVACMYSRGGMPMVRDFIEGYIAADRKLRMNTQRIAA